MSEIHGNEGPQFPKHPHQNEDHQEHPPQGIAFKGEKTDLRYDPGALKRTLINKNIKTQIGDHTVTFGAKEIQQVQKDLAVLDENPRAVQRAVALYPAFKGQAEQKGHKNTDALALAIQHYAATNEFIRNMELEEAENN